MHSIHKLRESRKRAERYADSLPTVDPCDVEKEKEQAREDARDTWIQGKEAEKRRLKRSGLSAVFIDIDGVIRNLTQWLADKFGIDTDTMTKTQYKDLFRKALPTLTSYELTELYVKAHAFDGSAKWIRDLKRDDSLDVYIVSASGFSPETKEATDVFLSIHRLASQEVLLCKSTEEKVAFINTRGSEYGSVIVIDDYQQVLRDIKIENGRYILIKHFPWIEEDDGRETSPDIASLTI